MSFPQFPYTVSSSVIDTSLKICSRIFNIDHKKVVYVRAYIIFSFSKSLPTSESYYPCKPKCLVTAFVTTSIHHPWFNPAVLGSEN